MKSASPAHPLKGTRLDSQNQVSALRASLALCLLLFPLRTVALPPEVESKIDKIFAPWNQSNTPGCAVGVFKQDQTIYAKGFGVANLENNTAITPETAFDIASISKQFTATAIVLLAQRGKLSLDDDVRKFIPELPSYGRTITLRHLIHHTSGLRDYDTLVSLHGTQDESVVHNQEALEMLCRQKHLNFNPGDQHSYSNSGYLLMALMVERITGKPFRQFLAENIFIPLGMSTAQVHDDHTKVIQNRAVGYTKDSQGEFHIDMSNWVITGDGQTYATIRDFAKWDRNFSEPKVGGPQWGNQMLVRGKLNDGTALDYAFGLKVDRFRGLDRVWHSGRWEGYRSTYVRFPKQELGIVILSNLGSFDPEAMAAKVVEILLERELTAVSEENLPVKRVKIEEALQNDFLGRYETFSPHFTVKISKGTNDLMMEVSGPPAFPIVPESTNQFATRDGKARLRFERGGNGKVARLTVLQGKDVFVHWKVDTDREAVSGCEGSFFSDEIEARYSIVIRDHRLVVKRGREEAALVPLEDEIDSFVGSEWWAEQVRFHQDNAGSINGFALTTGRLKNLEFRKE
jgi:CubicO group peptidase (beta-lactamase class C family)